MSPKISIAIATFNSQATLGKTLASLISQNYPQEQLEILIIDGGSSDQTIAIAKKYDVRIIKNPRVEPGFAKYLGLINASGDYLLYIDSDETIDNPDSLSIKANFLELNSNIALCLSQGYCSPKNFGFINTYINDFGDPFSCFIYRLSKLSNYFLSDILSKYPFHTQTKEIVVIDMINTNLLPMIEITTMGALIKLSILKYQFPELFQESHLIPHAFYSIARKFPLIAFAKDDVITHYASSTYKSYLGKIKSRIRNNIHFGNDLGLIGYTGRTQFDPPLFRLKKYLFLPYVFLALPLLFDTLYIIYKRRDFRYLFHAPLSLITALWICTEFTKKIFYGRQVKKSYGEEVKINKG